jgi:hypothetical protein
MRKDYRSFTRANKPNERTVLNNLCRAALLRHESHTLRWLPVDVYLEKTTYTPADAKAIARHLMRDGYSKSYDAGVEILREAGEPDLDIILPLHREAMSVHRTSMSLEHDATRRLDRTQSDRLLIADRHMNANRLAENIERESENRCH